MWWLHSRDLGLGKRRTPCCPSCPRGLFPFLLAARPHLRVWQPAAPNPPTLRSWPPSSIVPRSHVRPPHTGRHALQAPAKPRANVLERGTSRYTHTHTRVQPPSFLRGPRAPAWAPRGGENRIGGAPRARLEELDAEGSVLRGVLAQQGAAATPSRPSATPPASTPAWSASGGARELRSVADSGDAALQERERERARLRGASGCGCVGRGSERLRLCPSGREADGGAERVAPGAVGEVGPTSWLHVSRHRPKRLRPHVAAPGPSGRGENRGPLPERLPEAPGWVREGLRAVGGCIGLARIFLGSTDVQVILVKGYLGWPHVSRADGTPPQPSQLFHMTLLLRSCGCGGPSERGLWAGAAKR